MVERNSESSFVKIEITENREAPFYPWCSEFVSHPILLVSCLFQIKVWTANPQQFVEDEDDDTFSYTVRIAAQDLLLV